MKPGEIVSDRYEIIRFAGVGGMTLLRRVAVALHFVHERGVIHRDIKPSNLFLVNREPSQVKVLDSFDYSTAPV